MAATAVWGGVVRALVASRGGSPAVLPRSAVRSATEERHEWGALTPSGRSARAELEDAVRLAAEADRRFAEQLMSRPASGEAACAEELGGGQQAAEATPEKKRRGRPRKVDGEARVQQRGPMDSLFTTRLLSVAEERELGRVAQRLLAMEGAKEALLDEKNLKFSADREWRPRAGGRRGVRVRDPVVLERRLQYSLTEEFRQQWAARSNCSSVAELDECVEAGRAARQALVAANMRLVYSLAKRHEGHGVGFSDLVQEGAIGLMRAATKFDPARGYKFSTYAYHWIRQALLRALASDSRLIRLPMYVHDELVRLTRCRTAFFWQHGREPTDSEVCDTLSLSPDKLRKLDNAVLCGATVSTDSVVKPDFGGGGERPVVVAPPTKSALRLFDDASGSRRLVVTDANGNTRTRRAVSVGYGAPQPRKSNRDLKVSDTLTDHSTSSETHVENSLMHHAVRRALTHLTDDEQTVIRSRFGLDDGVVQTCAQIAKSVHETKEWVKSVESSALRKLRHPHNRNILYPHHQDYSPHLSL